jgi:Haem-binding uptake, Tiki superfamily, ChaN
MHTTHTHTLCSYDFNNYSKIFRYARLHGIRLVGLNAPVALVSLVSKQGLAALPRELSALLPEMDLGNAKHKARFHEAIAEVSGHLYACAFCTAFLTFCVMVLWCTFQSC